MPNTNYHNQHFAKILIWIYIAVKMPTGNWHWTFKKNNRTRIRRENGIFTQEECRAVVLLKY